MSRRDNSLRLHDMLAAAQEAVGFLGDRQEADLAQDRQLTLALLKCIEIIGEAASRVTAERRAELVAIPWAEMIGMRNRLVHAYFDVDLSLLFNTVREDLPSLIATLESSLGRS